MIRKLVIYLFFLTTLNGCAQGLAFLGPVLSYSKTGSVMQSALSYGTNVAFKKVRAKSSTENMENAFDENKTINNSDFFKSAKNKIDNSSSITNLANQ
tara:strand:- start:545 stop:838 length:294 start_codon:yes stop_codon:yes gene_type:complete